MREGKEMVKGTLVNGISFVIVKLESQYTILMSYPNQEPNSCSVSGTLDEVMQTLSGLIIANCILCD